MDGMPEMQEQFSATPDAEIKPDQSAIQRYLQPGVLPYNLLVFSAPPVQL
jgi:hypothetical protein